MKRLTTAQHTTVLLCRNWRCAVYSGAGTNLKVGAPVRRESGGGHRSGKKRQKCFFLCSSTFLALQLQSVVFVSAFAMVSTVWSVSCMLFFYSWCPRAQPFVKVGGTCPRALWSRRHWLFILEYSFLSISGCKFSFQVATVCSQLMNYWNLWKLNTYVKAFIKYEV